MVKFLLSLVLFITQNEESCFLTSNECDVTFYVNDFFIFSFRGESKHEHVPGRAGAEGGERES